MGKDKKIIESQSVDIDKLNLADYNPRIMLEQDKDELRKSIETFGLVEPIVANSDFTVIGGHQRLVVAREMGFKTVPCVIVTLDKKQELRTLPDERG